MFKTLVYDLARWRNKNGDVIPQNTIDKPPAELRPNQKDSDSLPPYEVLDEILASTSNRTSASRPSWREGSSGTVARVAAMVDRNEYKRRQAAPGSKSRSRLSARIVGSR